MKIKEIRGLSATELRERIEAERVNLAQMRMNHAISPLEDSSKLAKSRKTIARMLTVLSQLENGEQK